MVDTNSSRKIVVLGTGGTIAGHSALVNDNISYDAAQIDIEPLVRNIQGLKSHVNGFKLAFEQVAQVDSKDMDFAIWQALARRVAVHIAEPDVQGIVITHGTDTLEETAYFLRSVVCSAKPVVLTCAMRPASALNPDGPQNLMDALSVVMDAKACGVLVVCAGVVHAAEHVQKIHPYRLDAFSSGEAGPLAWTEEGRVRWSVGTMASALPHRDALSLPESGAWPEVEIVFNCVGANGKVVDALVKQAKDHILDAKHTQGDASLEKRGIIRHHYYQAILVQKYASRCHLQQEVVIGRKTLRALENDRSMISFKLQT